MNSSPIAVLCCDVEDVPLVQPGTAPLRARRTMARLMREGIVPVLCSSRTRAELGSIQQELALRSPFIVEDGAAIFVPSGYFQVPVPGSREIAGYDAIEFGRPYVEVVRALRETAGRLAIGIRGFSDMSVWEVANECHLSLLHARLAKLRDYVEVFSIVDREPDAGNRLARALSASGLRCVEQGRYHHVGTAVHRATAVVRLKALYRQSFGPIMVIGSTHATPADYVLSSADHKMIAMNEGGSADLEEWGQAIVDFVAERRPFAQRSGLS